MSDNTERKGLGKVIYSVDDPKTKEAKAEEKTNEAEVEEASEESFPASDPPGYAKGASSDCT
jgi:hypothetical protein